MRCCFIASIEIEIDMDLLLLLLLLMKFKGKYWLYRRNIHKIRNRKVKGKKRSY